MALFRGEDDARGSEARQLETIGNGCMTRKGKTQRKRDRDTTVRVGLIY
jgi:hypothetical protein